MDSELLRDCLRLAIAARKVDMRASPYDVSGVQGCGQAIAVETPEGRKLYVEEQERLAETAEPLRRRLIVAYELALRDVEELLPREATLLVH